MSGVERGACLMRLSREGREGGREARERRRHAPPALPMGGDVATCRGISRAVAMRRGVSRAFLLINHVSVSHLIPSSPSLPFLSHSLNFSVPLSSPLSLFTLSLIYCSPILCLWLCLSLCLRLCLSVRLTDCLIAYT
jgi:hypothetical protein